MGYFSNGTEGDAFEARYCNRCVHGPNVAEYACPVFDAHLLFAYEECNSKSNAKVMLDMLIERTTDGVPGNRCRMFVERAHADQVPMFGGAA